MNRKINTISAAFLAAAISASFAGCANDEKPNSGNSKFSELNESNIESYIESVFSSGESSTPSETSEPEEVKFEMTDEIKNAALDSGLIQLNNEVFQQGGYITVADFVEKYKDTYDITYKDGTYEERKDYLIEYKKPEDYFATYVSGQDLKEVYCITLTPKSGKSVALRAFNVVIGNFTSPDEKITLDKAIVIGYRVIQLVNGHYENSILPIWLPKGIGLTGNLNSNFDNRKAPDDIETVNENYTSKSFGEFLEQQGFTLVEKVNGDYDKKYIAGNGYIAVYALGETNLFGLKPVYYYSVTFNNDTDKMDHVSFSIYKFIK